MSANHETDKGTISPVTELLSAHADLIGQTSSEMAGDLVTYISRVKTKLAQSDVGLNDDLREHLDAALVSLQKQDLLFQQVEVFKKGLALLGEARVPKDIEPEEWQELTFDGLKSSYVMASQLNLHKRYFGEDVQPDTGDSATLF